MSSNTAHDARCSTMRRVVQPSRQHVVRTAVAVTMLAFSGCPPFQPEIAQRPPPYTRRSTFVAPAEVAHVPQLDRGTFTEPDDPALRTDPGELAAAPGLVRQCLVSSIANGVAGFRVVDAAEAPPDAFRMQLGVVVARPGFFRADRTSGASAGATAGGAGAAGSGQLMTAGTSSTAQAEAILEIRAPAGALVDRVRLYVQRTTQVGESLESRASNLCAMLAEKVRAYLLWRLDP